MNFKKTHLWTTVVSLSVLIVSWILFFGEKVLLSTAILISLSMILTMTSLIMASKRRIDKNV
ncbi:hypothetical protein SAMN05444412_103338 [Rhodonellum ikkaensis]|uniref:Uncharacterized protein n=1 Tax=Rhodonellum ikkaensis TaxID=336829 RepID=A0A1H3NNA6_9BACT|nr:hypothetical protein SAMN05444412_103338 [Rhodonellum ikkaensis]